MTMTTTPKKVSLKSLMAPILEHNRKVEKRYLRSPAGAAKAAAGRKVVVHNQVVPVTGFGWNGSRSWSQLPDDEIEVCPCRWFPQLGKHYRVRRTA
jgi:hypothetical protein